MMRIGLAALLFLVACGDDDVSDASDSAAPDAAVDARPDAPSDAAPDADDASADATDADLADDGSADGGPADARDAGTTDPFEGAGTVELVASAHDGTDFAFLEGPHWRGERLYFVDLNFSRLDLQTIYALDPTDDSIELILRPSEGANGIATDADGALVTCLQGGHRVVTLVDGAYEPRAERFEGARFNAPNDLVFRSDGDFYFTDPGYGIAPEDREIAAHGLYRVSEEGIERVWTGTTDQRPNGVALSPDESTLYLADTADEVVRAFSVAADGSLSEERTFDDGLTGADGMTVDTAGNLFVTTREGVVVFDPVGRRRGVLEVPMTPSNCAFGDADRQTLYITARASLYRVRLGTRGL